MSDRGEWMADQSGTRDNEEDENCGLCGYRLTNEQTARCPFCGAPQTDDEGEPAAPTETAVGGERV